MKYAGVSDVHNTEHSCKPVSKLLLHFKVYRNCTTLLLDVTIVEAKSKVGETLLLNAGIAIFIVFLPHQLTIWIALFMPKIKKHK